MGATLYICKQSCHVLHDFRVFSIQVIPFRNVLAEIEELPGMVMRGIPSFFLEPVGLLVVIAARCVNEYPVVLTDRKSTRAAMVDGRAPHHGLSVALQQGQHVDTVLGGIFR